MTEHMTAEGYMVWYDAQPAGHHYELFEGWVRKKPVKQLIEVKTKAHVACALATQISERHLSCEALLGGMAVRIDNETVFEPDALVRCGPPLADDTTLLLDPVIVVEVASPTTQHVDGLEKLSRYFNNRRIVHYLIVVPRARLAIHHKRAADDHIETRTYREGEIPLDPPGLTLAVGDLFPDKPPSV